MSRKVPQPPAWVQLGRTRIFLVHRGDRQHSQEGELFGYFRVGRLERLGPAQTLPALSERDALWTPDDSKDSGKGLLQGRVIDAETGKPVPGGKGVTANGTSPGKGASATVTHQGRYELRLDPGEYTLSASGDGYGITKVVGVSVTEGRQRRQDLFLEPKERRFTELTAENADGSVVITHAWDEDRRKWVPRRCKDGAVRTRRCPNGSVIETHRCENRRWVPTGNRCDENGDGERCIEGEIRLAVCADGTAIVIERCAEGVWKKTGAECERDREHPDDDDVLGIDDEMFVPHRSCSLRLKPRACYLVDSLAAAISQAFRGDAPLRAIKRKYARALTQKGRLAQIEEGRRRFRVVVNEVRQRLGVPSIPQGARRPLTGGTYGCLVLFDTPYPVFVREAEASFRSLVRVDGDRLLELINRRQSARLPGCGGSGFEASIRWS